VRDDSQDEWGKCEGAAAAAAAGGGLCDWTGAAAVLQLQWLAGCRWCLQWKVVHGGSYMSVMLMVACRVFRQVAEVARGSGLSNACPAQGACAVQLL
jgi:hypothetical protein